MAGKYSVTGDQYRDIDRKLREIKRQLDQKEGSPLNPTLVSYLLQSIIDPASSWYMPLDSFEIRYVPLYGLPGLIYSRLGYTHSFSLQECLGRCGDNMTGYEGERRCTLVRFFGPDDESKPGISRVGPFNYRKVTTCLNRLGLRTPTLEEMVSYACQVREQRLHGDTVMLIDEANDLGMTLCLDSPDPDWLGFILFRPSERKQEVWDKGCTVLAIAQD